MGTKAKKNHRKPKLTKKEMFVVVDKKNSNNIFGSFPKTSFGKTEAEAYIKKIQKEHPTQLFIEPR